jgi:hypothetical protein
MSAPAFAVRLEEEQHTLQTGWDACHATIFDGFRYRWSLPDRALDRAADVSAARALGRWVSDLRILLARGSEYVRRSNKSITTGENGISDG